MSAPTTSYGVELAPGDHTDIDDVPICCDTDMTGKDSGGGDRDYRCTACGAVVTVQPNGLISYITA